MAEHKNTRDADSWSAYWAGAEAASESVTGGAKGVALDRFWTSFFDTHFKADAVTMIDLACGAGPVSARATQMAKSANVALSLYCTDYSAAAIRSLAEAPGAAMAGFVADAAVLPLADDICDMATSQFGLEYAGQAAFDEAARIVRPGGAFAAVIHLKGGAIEEECAANLDIVVNTQEIGLLPHARDAFEAGFAVFAGRAPRKNFEEADKALAPVVDAAKKLLAASPPVIARTFLERLYTDLAHMYPRISAYAPDDIKAWIDRGEFELKAYEHRMASMVAAAQSESDMAALIGRLRSAGFDVAAPEILEMGEPLKPAAWTLLAKKTGVRKNPI